MAFIKKLFILLLVSPVLISATASPGMAEIDGNMILDNCKEAVTSLENKNTPSINSSAVNFCFGYLSGINDLHSAFVSSSACFDPPVYCNSQQADAEQLVRIIVKFLKAHPEDLHFQGSVLIVSALKEAFPCP